MPGKNIVKTYVADGYYHVYNRGVNKQDIFKDDDDYRVFLNLFKRYLDDVPHKDNKGREYIWLHEQITLAAYCLMPNHFHLLIMQKEPDAMTQLLRNVCTTYTTYFNKKHKRVGSLFQGVYKASRITNDAYLQHISRYIHLNPDDYKSWDYSSYKYFLGKAKAAWISPKLILDMFEGESYADFVADYEDHKQMLDEIKSELANI